MDLSCKADCLIQIENLKRRVTTETDRRRSGEGGDLMSVERGDEEDIACVLSVLTKRVLKCLSFASHAREVVGV
jgi:hypothetical protein